MTKWKTVRMRHADWVRLTNDMPSMQRRVDWLQHRQDESCFQNWYLNTERKYLIRSRREHRWILGWNRPDRLPGHPYDRS